MATFADPNGNGTATAWTNTFANVDEQVRQPSAPDGLTVSSSTDEASETLVFTDPAFVAGATYTLWVYSSSGAKRGLDVAYSVNGSDPGTGHASRAELHGASAGAAWRSRVVTIANQTELNNLRVQLICNATAGGGGAGSVSVDAVYVEITLPAVTGAAAQTLPGLGQDAAGAALVDGTSAQALPGLTQDASGTVVSPVSGAAVQTLPGLSQDATGAALVDGAAASGLPTLDQGATGALQVDGAAASALPALGQDGTGTVESNTVSGGAAQDLPALGQSAGGAAHVGGQAASGLPGFDQDGAGTMAVTGEAGGVLGALATAAGGELRVAGDGSQTLPSLATTGDGEVFTPATGAITALLGALAVDAEGTVTVPWDGFTIRHCLYRQLHLASAVSAQLFGTPVQLKALFRGAPVVVTREQLQGFSHPRIPADVADHESWLLTGDDTLTPQI